MAEQPQDLKTQQRLPSLTFGALIALGAALTAGVVAHTSQNPSLLSFASFIEPLGLLWTNALRMVVIPLVISSLFLAIASVLNTKAVGRLGVLSLLVFIGLLSLGALFALAAAPPLMVKLSIDPAIGATLGAGPTVAASSVPEDAKQAPTFSQWLVELVPTNPFKAAADEAILPLIIFTISFALATTRISPERSQLLVNFFQAVSEAMLILVRWILWFTPVGVFALTFSFIARTGPNLIGVLGYFVVVVCTLLFAFTLALYPLAAIVGRVSLRRFAEAVAPAQLVAVSTRSSLASLPAVIVGAEQKLRLPRAITGFVLPLSVSTFKVNRTISSIVKLLFLTRLYGIQLTPTQITVFTIMVVAFSFSSPGIPSAGSIRTIPAYLALGIPIEGVLVFNAVEIIPDIFKTLLNVTGDMTGAAIVARIAGISPALSTVPLGVADESAATLKPDPELLPG